MKYILSIFVLLTLVGCNECDFTIPNNYRDFLHNYKVGDTIYFESNFGGIDTMLIVKYDTLEECGQGFMSSGPKKHLNYQIEHLPENIWTGGTEFSGNHDNELNQKLVVLVKTFNSKHIKGFFTSINYREFGGEVVNINKMTNDDRFSDLGVSKYWKVKKSNYNKQKALPETVIHNVYWSTKYGLTGYEYGNGEIYKIKNLK